MALSHSILPVELLVIRLILLGHASEHLQKSFSHPLSSALQIFFQHQITSPQSSLTVTISYWLAHSDSTCTSFPYVLHFYLLHGLFFYIEDGSSTPSPATGCLISSSLVISSQKMLIWSTWLKTGWKFLYSGYIT